MLDRRLAGLDGMVMSDALPSSGVAHRNGRVVGLTGNEKRLVEVIVHAASRGTELTREQAGTAAGYGKGETARVSASRALKRPEVREALMEGLRECATIDAAASYGVLRHLARRSKSDRVRLDAAVAMARIGGLDVQQVAPAGAGVTLNLVLAPQFAALLAQPPAPDPQVIDADEEPEAEHCPPQAKGGGDPDADGGVGGSTRGGATTPPGEKSRASVSSPGSTHDFPPEKSQGVADG